MSQPAAGLRVLRGPEGAAAAHFQAMASPCTVLADGADKAELMRLGAIAAAEALRVQDKWSRYQPGNLVDRINRAQGAAIEVDAETARLLDFAAALWAESQGRFDITSGVLRRAWKFDGSDRVPSREAVEALLPLVGWDKVEWNASRLRMRPGMEIDFGGVGKEYAVDRALSLLREATPLPVLVNFGGDLAASGPRRDGSAWTVGIEHAGTATATPLVRLARGAVATSGDARRFLLKDGIRYPHVLDPHSGWPVPGAPRSVTVAAETCSEAGALSTLALLKGSDAEAFLESRGADCHVIR